MSSSGTDALECVICEKKFDTAEAKREHGWTHLHYVRVEKEFKQNKKDGDELSFKCDLCDCTVKVLSEMLKHIDCQEHVNKVELWKGMTVAKASFSGVPDKSRTNSTPTVDLTRNQDAPGRGPPQTQWDMSHYDYYDFSRGRDPAWSGYGYHPYYQNQFNHGYVNFPGNMRYNNQYWNYAPPARNYYPNYAPTTHGNSPHPQVLYPSQTAASASVSQRNEKTPPEKSTSTPTSKEKESIGSISKRKPPPRPDDRASATSSKSYDAPTGKHSHVPASREKYRWIKSPSKSDEKKSRTESTNRNLLPLLDSRGKRNTSSTLDKTAGQDRVTENAKNPEKTSATYEAPTPKDSRNLQPRFSVWSSVRGKSYEKKAAQDQKSYEEKNKGKKKNKKSRSEKRREAEKLLADLAKIRLPDDGKAAAEKPKEAESRPRQPATSNPDTEKRQTEKETAQVQEADSTTSGSSQEDSAAKKSTTRTQSTCTTSRNVPETRESKIKNWEKQIKKTKATTDKTIEAAWRKRQESYHLHASPYVALEEGEIPKEKSPEIEIISGEPKSKEPKHIHKESRATERNFIQAKTRPDAKKVKKEIPPHFTATFTTVASQPLQAPTKSVTSANPVTAIPVTTRSVQDIVQSVESAYQATLAEIHRAEEPLPERAPGGKEMDSAPREDENAKKDDAKKPPDVVGKPGQASKTVVKQEIIDPPDQRQEAFAKEERQQQKREQFATQSSAKEAELTRRKELLPRSSVRQPNVEGLENISPPSTTTTAYDSPQESLPNLNRPLSTTPVGSKRKVHPGEFSFAFARAEAEALRMHTPSASVQPASEPSETRRSSPRKRKLIDRFSPEKEADKQTEHLRALWEVCQAEERLQEEMKLKDQEISTLTEQLALKRQEQCQRFMALEAVRKKRKNILENQSTSSGPVPDSNTPSSSSGNLPLLSTLQPAPSTIPPSPSSILPKPTEMHSEIPYLSALTSTLPSSLLSSTAMPNSLLQDFAQQMHRLKENSGSEQK